MKGWISLLGLLAVSLAAAEPAGTTGTILFADDFHGGLAGWVVEQQPGGTVTAKDGHLIIDDAGGCTVWLRRELEVPVLITYVARVSSASRVSDLNCFWMATDPAAPGGEVLATSARRTGALAEYDALRLYYVGAGGNANTTTRFRRYTGTGERPLLPEHDLRDRRFLLRGNQTYHVILLAAGGRVQYLRDGVVFFDYADPQPLTTGRFGFRTVHSRIELRHFRVWRARVAND
jgi:hypothetical protein